jgi:hypothetical protein
MRPRIERRFEPLTSLHEITPVFLKYEARIETLFTRICQDSCV